MDKKERDTIAAMHDGLIETVGIIAASITTHSGITQHVISDIERALKLIRKQQHPTISQTFAQAGLARTQELLVSMKDRENYLKT